MTKGTLRVHEKKYVNFRLKTLSQVSEGIRRRPQVLCLVPFSVTVPVIFGCGYDNIVKSLFETRQP